LAAWAQAAYRFGRVRLPGKIRPPTARLIYRPARRQRIDLRVNLPGALAPGDRRRYLPRS